MNSIALLIAVAVTAVLVLPTAALTKLFMRLLFGRVVWFGLAYLASVIAVGLTLAAELLFGFGGWDSLDDIYTLEGQKEAAVGFLLQILLFTVLVPDTKIRFISPLKWAAVGAVVYAISLAIFLLILKYVDPSMLGLKAALNNTRFV